MDMTWLVELGPYHWLALAAILIGIEMVMPTQYLIWPGIGALVTGVLAFFVELGGATQFAIFAVLSAILVTASHYYLPRSKGGDVSGLNERTAQMVGRVATVAEDFHHGQGAVTVGDTRWSARSADGSDMAAGTRVEIVAAESTLLTVKRV